MGIHKFFELLDGILVLLLHFSQHTVSHLDLLNLLLDFVWVHIQIRHVVETACEQYVVASVTK